MQRVLDVRSRSQAEFVGYLQLQGTDRNCRPVDLSLDILPALKHWAFSLPFRKGWGDFSGQDSSNASKETAPSETIRSLAGSDPSGFPFFSAGPPGSPTTTRPIISRLRWGAQK